MLIKVLEMLDMSQLLSPKLTWTPKDLLGCRLFVSVACDYQLCLRYFATKVAHVLS